MKILIVVLFCAATVSSSNGLGGTISVSGDSANTALTFGNAISLDVAAEDLPGTIGNVGTTATERIRPLFLSLTELTRSTIPADTIQIVGNTVQSVGNLVDTTTKTLLGNANMGNILQLVPSNGAAGGSSGSGGGLNLVNLINPNTASGQPTRIVIIPTNTGGTIGINGLNTYPNTGYIVNNVYYPPLGGYIVG